MHVSMGWHKYNWCGESEGIREKVVAKSKLPHPPEKGLLKLSCKTPHPLSQKRSSDASAKKL